MAQVSEVSRLKRKLNGLQSKKQSAQAKVTYWRSRAAEAHAEIQNTKQGIRTLGGKISNRMLTAVSV